MQQQVIQAKLSDRLISELPRFFGGRQAAYRELFQNAHRAGAKHVTIRLTGDLLVFEDDGAGCPDPQVLLEAGQTGWDEARVKEPAGVGFYSLMDKDVASRVVVESNAWRIVLEPDHVLARKPVVVEEGSVKKGMRIMLHLVDPKGSHQEELRHARAYYPYDVTFNGEPVLPPTWKPGLEVQTSVGLVGMTLGRGHHSPSAVWEHRPISTKNLEAAIRKAAGEDIVRVAMAHRAGDIVWFVDPACGVTPKLPDRNELKQDEALENAAHVILDALTSEIMKGVVEESKAWPNVLESLPKLPKILGSSDYYVSDLREAVLASLGWKKASWTSWSDTTMYDDGDRYRINTEHAHVYAKNILRVDDSDVVASINIAASYGANLPYAVWDRGEALVVELVDEQKPTDGWVGLCKEIRVGDYQLPFLLNEEDGTIRLATTNAEVGLDALLDNAVQLPGFNEAVSIGRELQSFMLYNSDQKYEFIDDDDKDAVDWRKVEGAMVTEFCTQFMPTMAAARSTYYGLVQTMDGFLRVEKEVKDFVSDEILGQLPEMQKLKEALADAHRAAKAKLEAAKREARVDDQ